MRYFSSLLMVLPFALLMSCERHTHLTFLETTDSHGCLSELSEEASFIAQQRSQLGDNLILLDAGDNLQGTVYTYLANRESGEQHVVSRIFNYLGYDVVCVGNHDIEAGKNVFNRYFSELDADVVCANVIDAETGEPYFKPYTVIERDGFRIAVLGLLTPYVTTWVPERLRSGLIFEKIENAAQRWENVIRLKENPDLMVAIVHSGYEPVDEQVENPVLGLENASLWIARNTGFDIVFFGHDHRPLVQTAVNKVGAPVFLVNAGSHGRNLARVDVELTEKNGKLTRNIEAKLVPTEHTGARDSVYDQIVRKWIDRCDEIQNEKITTLDNDIMSSDAVKGCNEWVGLIHQLQFDVVKNNGIDARISFAAALSGNKVLHAGDLCVRDFFTLYPFENTLAVVKMTGAEVKKYLEFSYRNYFVEHGPLYNFDSASGIDYTVLFADNKIRINILGMSDGSDFDENSTYNVAMNSYRAMGGGGHLLNGLGWSQETISDNTIWSSELELRNLFIDWARRFDVLNTVVSDNWTWVNE